LRLGPGDEEALAGEELEAALQDRQVSIKRNPWGRPGEMVFYLSRAVPWKGIKLEEVLRGEGSGRTH